MYVTGDAKGTLPESTETNAGSQDVFLAKDNTSGTKLWVHQLGSAADDIGEEVAVDKSGNVAVP